jgi:hypothetical protein
MNQPNQDADIDANKLLQAQVYRLIESIRSGNLVLGEQVADVAEALEEVKFDRRGLPLLHTVPERIRSHARIHAMIEAARQQEEDDEIAATSPLRKALPERTEVTQDILNQCAHDSRFLPLAFNLYGEVITLVVAAGLIQQMSGLALERNQAICAGSLVRIGKLMRATLTLAEDQQHHEAIYTLHRPIVESLVTVRYLIAKDETRFYDQFVEYSLGPEREVYDDVQENIKERGGATLPIEERMLRSIRLTAEKSGLKIEDVSREDKNWGGNVRNRMLALGEAQQYGGFYRLPSHAVHGTWVDLLMHHLNYDAGKFTVNLKSKQADVRDLLPLGRLVLIAAFEYLQAFYGNHPQLRPVYEHISDLDARIMATDAASEQWRIIGLAKAPR